MVILRHTVIAVLILQIYVSAAPNEVPKQDDVAEVKQEGLKLDEQPNLLNKTHGSQNSSQRQKRFYNHFGFPPLPYPSYNRDQASDLGVFGWNEDPLNHIHRRLQEIASVVKQSVPPPPPPPPVTPHIPLYFPVIFLPHFGCSCNPDTKTPQTSNTQPTQKPQQPQGPQPANPTANPSFNEGITPDIFNRMPDLEDERQNSGVNPEEVDDEEDYSRPISFDPIVLNTSMFRPAPPVEHGSSQAGTVDGMTTTTTVSPNLPSAENPQRELAAAAPYPPSPTESPREAPSACDGAVLSCCHQPRVSYDCFAVLGCPDPTSYANPCNPLVILSIIEKYQKFYGVKAG